MPAARVLAVLVAAMASLGAPTPTGYAGPGATSSTDAGCSWPTKLNQDTFNFFFPDTSATYWGTHLPFVDAYRVVIRGAYPNARYFSFHAYDEAQRPVASIADREIVPDEGTNPFADRSGHSEGKDPGRYTVYVEFTPRPEKPKPNTMYAGAMADGGPNPAGFLIYRIYIPDRPDQPTAGVPLPQVTLETAGGAVPLEFDQCEPVPPDTGGQVNEEVKSRDYAFDTGSGGRHPAATDPLTFKPFYGTDQFPRDFNPNNTAKDSAEAASEGGFLSNHHIAYLYAYVGRGYGDLIVLRIKAPTFPDTRAGDAPTARSQLRYWSLCHNNGISQRVVDCVADYQTPIDASGFATIVISDPSDRPKNATARNGISWLPWGALYPEGIVIYRHMLPADSFEGAVQRVPEGESARVTMDEYYPLGTYCSTERFEKRGWAGCLKRTFGH